MELQQLEQLVTIAEKGTLSAAAQELLISQPALTRSMQRLEADLGVALFERSKNKVELNEAGLLAVEQARRVLDDVQAMAQRMTAYARSQHTIAVGSCAPGPMWTLAPQLSALYPDLTITTELCEPEDLPRRLESGAYQLIITDAPLAGDGILCREYVSERLYVSLPPAHPLAAKPGVTLSDLEGQTMLLFSDLGVWQKLHDEKMRGIHFIVQTQREAFSDLISASVLPNFSTDLTHRLVTPPINRVDIPILDSEATITFYLCGRAKSKRIMDAVLANV